MKGLGFKALRVRDYGESCRVQIDNFKQAQLMQKKIISTLENFGYKQISIEKVYLELRKLEKTLQEKGIINNQAYPWQGAKNQYIFIIGDRTKGNRHGRL